MAVSPTHLRQQLTNELDALNEYAGGHPAYSALETTVYTDNKLYDAWQDRLRRYTSALQQHITQLQSDHHVPRTLHADIVHIYTKLIELHTYCVAEKLHAKHCNDKTLLSRYAALFQTVTTPLQTYITNYIRAHIHTIRSTVVTSVCNAVDTQWSKKRDLPASLLQKYKITSASNSILYYYIYMSDLYSQLCGCAPACQTLTHVVYTQTLHATLSLVHQVYKCLEVSRFSHRQYVVDLAALLLIGRTLLQRCTDTVDTAKQRTAELNDAINQIDTVCNSIALHIVCVAAPLSQLNAMLSSTNKPTPHTPAVIDTLSKHLYSLMHQPITPTDQIAQMTQLELTEDTVLCHNWSTLSAALTPHCTVNVELRAQLCGYAGKRHELNVDDYPELSAEQMQDVTKLKSLLQLTSNVVG